MAGNTKQQIKTKHTSESKMSETVGGPDGKNQASIQQVANFSRTTK